MRCQRDEISNAMKCQCDVDLNFPIREFFIVTPDLDFRLPYLIIWTWKTNLALQKQILGKILELLSSISPRIYTRQC